MDVALGKYYLVCTTPWVLFPALHRDGRGGGLEQWKGSAIHQECYLRPNKPSPNEGEYKKVSGRQKHTGLPAVPPFSRLKGIHVHNAATGRHKEILRR